MPQGDCKRRARGCGQDRGVVGVVLVYTCLGERKWGIILSVGAVFQGFVEAVWWIESRVLETTEEGGSVSGLLALNGSATLVFSNNSPYHVMSIIWSESGMSKGLFEVVLTTLFRSTCKSCDSRHYFKHQAL